MFKQTLYNSDIQTAQTLICSGENTLVLGAGGTRKSVLIGSVQELFRENYIFVAPVGVAAYNIEGSTCHSSFGLSSTIFIEGDKLKPFNKAQQEAIKSDELVGIIIDEASTLRSDKFLEISTRISRIRNNSAPFGGLQIVLVGDFFQLAPVVTPVERKLFNKHYTSPFVFGTELFKKCNFTLVELGKVYRQTNPQTVAALSFIRKGNHIEAAVEYFNRNCVDASELKSPIFLCTTNQKVDEINNREFKNIKGKAHKFIGEITGKFPDLPVSKELNLKVGCKVMITKNDYEPDPEKKRYSNGSTGVVESIVKPSNKMLNDEWCINVKLDSSGEIVPIFRFHYNNIVKKESKEGNLYDALIGEYVQFPLKLAYALTIYKSQGLTLDEVVLDLDSNYIPPALAYVGLSRIKDIKKLALSIPLRYDHIKVDYNVKRLFGGDDGV